ncbi:hypothetical protein Tco_0865996 [Tanacetum coccineum]
MSNQSEDIQAVGSNTHPPMLMGRCRDKIVIGTDGPYLGPERDRVVVDLSQAEKDRLRADIRVTNILLQGSELTKDDHESQLYDEFEHFGQHKGENIHDYYVSSYCSDKFMTNLSSADPVYVEAGPSYDSDTLSEVQDHDNCLDNMNESHEEHEIHNDDNKDQVVHSDVSSVPNDVVMIITNDIYEQDDQCVTSNKTNNIVNASLTAELARYKELAEVYEKRAQFELTERELMIDTHMRRIIKDRNVKEESLQKELHSVKMQLNSTLNHTS